MAAELDSLGGILTLRFNVPVNSLAAPDDIQIDGLLIGQQRNTDSGTTASTDQVFTMAFIGGSSGSPRVSYGSGIFEVTADSSPLPAEVDFPVTVL